MIRSLILLAITGSAAPALAQFYADPAYADLAEVDRAVVAFTGAAQGSPGGAAMPVDRRLRLAPCPAPLALGWYGARQDSVEVRCPVGRGWKLYVPLNGGGADLAAAPPVIARGDAVTISVSGAGFAVSQPGEALEAGPAGAWIKVRAAGHTATGATTPVLRAQVLRPGLVGMDLP